MPTHDHVEQVHRDRAAFEQSGLPQVHVDLHGCVVEANAALARLLRTTPRALAGTEVLAHFELLEEIGTNELAALLSGRAPAHADHEIAYRDGEGRQRTLLVRVTVLQDENGRPFGLHAVAQETSEVARQLHRVTAERALFGGTHPKAWDGAVVVDSEACISYVSPSILETFGYRSQELLGRSAFDFIHLDDEPQSRMALETALATPRGVVHATARARSAEGEWRWCDITLTNALDDPDVGGLIAVLRDTTDHLQSYRELKQQALHDALTGLPNRLLFDDRLEMAAARHRRDPSHGVAVLFMDVDGLKQVNDHHGHAAGDRLLVEVAQRLASVVRDSDTVARLAGDEFAVVCEAADVDRARQVAARVQDALSTPVDLGGVRVDPAASIGVATAPPHDPSDLLSLADAAMYAAKGSRARVVVHDEQLASESTRRKELQDDVGAAVRAGTVTPRYEAVVDLRTGALVSLHAEPSWVHPTWGPVAPEDLMHSARAAGVLGSLEERVLRTACADLCRLHDAGAVPAGTTVSVDVDGPTASATLLEVIDSLAGASLRPDRVRLRLRSADLSAQLDPQVLHAITARGPGLALAVGLEPLSLWEVHGLPLVQLVLEPEVLRVRDDERRVSLLRTLTAVGAALEVPLMATGTCSGDDVETLLACGVGLSQGPWHEASVPVEVLLPS